MGPTFPGRHSAFGTKETARPFGLEALDRRGGLKTGPNGKICKAGLDDLWGKWVAIIGNPIADRRADDGQIGDSGLKRTS